MEVLGKLEADGLALTQGWWRLVGTSEDGGQVELTGRGAMVSRCRPDGSWRIVLDNPMAASEAPGAPGPLRAGR
jgi:ketosteroid isomerase-like protein